MTIKIKKIKGEINMEYVFYGLLAVAFIAFVVLVIRSYKKSLQADVAVQVTKALRKTRLPIRISHIIPMKKLLLLTEWSVKTVPQE